MEARRRGASRRDDDAAGRAARSGRAPPQRIGAARSRLEHARPGPRTSPPRSPPASRRRASRRSGSTSAASASPGASTWRRASSVRRATRRRLCSPCVTVSGVDRTRHAGRPSVGATIAIRLARATLARRRRPARGRDAPGEDVMRWQSERIAASFRGRLEARAGRFLRGQESRRRCSRARATSWTIEGGLPALWLREYMAYDPAADLPAIGAPCSRSRAQRPPGGSGRRRSGSGGSSPAPFTGSAPADLTHVLRRHTAARAWHVSGSAPQPVDPGSSRASRSGSRRGSRRRRMARCS